MAVSGVISVDLDIHDASGNDLVAPPAITDASDYDEFSVYYGEVVSADAFVSLPFGPVTTAEMVIVVSDQELTIKLNTDAAILFPCKELLVLKSTTGLTQVDIKNYSGSAAVVKAWILGT